MKTGLWQMASGVDLGKTNSVCTVMPEPTIFQWHY